MFGTVQVLIQRWRISTLLLISLSLTLASCSQKAPKAKTAFDRRQEQTQREKWRKETMTGAYDRVGRKDPKWDEAARNALDSFAIIQMKPGEEQNQDGQRIAMFAAQAVQAGCDDPLINYLYIYGNYDRTAHPSNEVVQTYLKTAADMSASEYSEIRKFYACLRMAGNLRELGRTTLGNEYGQLRAEASAHLGRALVEKDLPAVEARDACLALLDATRTSKPQFEPFYRSMEPVLFQRYENTTAPYAVKGTFYGNFAWQARGTGTADQVTEEGAKLFAERLQTAKAAFEAGWKIDPGDPMMPTSMLWVMKGLESDKTGLELWFQRAMAADTNNWQACNNKLNYLFPQWYGSPEEMLEFGRECLTNQAWGGDVTLVLVDAHQHLADFSGEGMNYWKRPEVWPDVHSAFEEFFRRNPEATRSRHNYCWYANACGDWKVLNEQLPKLGPVNYAYFGGKVAFDDMVRNAHEHAAK